MDKKRTRNREVLIVIVVIILVFLSVGIWWLFSSGHLTYSSSGSLSTVACGTDVVDKFNKEADKYYQLSSGSAGLVINKQPIKDLVADIKTKANFETDPTCQAIIFWAAVQDDNYKSANGAYNKLIDLHNKRIFADSNLQGSQPLSAYKDTMKSLTGSGFTINGSIGG
ncbi:MAG: hypothetical protein NTV39_03985 [Candidatus Saccharibacteria bacterium]|nr:hypothetical protein [Candidatus Saccharibacteria bacterium]